MVETQRAAGLSKLAICDKERRSLCWRRLVLRSHRSRGGIRLESSMQHFLSDTPVVFPRRVRTGGAGTQSRAPRAGIYLLGTVRCHALLPTRPSAISARDLWRSGRLRRQTEASRGAGRAAQIHLVLRQRTPTLGAVSDCLPSAFRPHSSPTGGCAATIPLS